MISHSERYDPQKYLFQQLLELIGIEALLEKIRISPQTQDGMEYIHCPLSRIDDTEVVARRGYPGARLRNVICRKCGLIYINPRMTPEAYQRFYEEEFFEYLDPFNRPGYVKDIYGAKDDAIHSPTETIVLPFIIDHIQNGAKILDVGAGFGNLLYLLQKHKGCEVHGLEPGDRARQISEEIMGIRLSAKTVEEFIDGKGGEKYDFIIMNQTLEHLLGPLSVLKELSNYFLADDGLIFIGVPNAYNPSTPMSIFFQVAHTFSYTPYTLGLLAEQANLKIVKLSDPHSPVMQALLASRDSVHDAVSPELLHFGRDWREVASIFRRRRFWNVTRGISAKFLRMTVGEPATMRLKAWFDGVTGFKY
ncbi:MAG: class I SAM-dependent methyltransferase [Chloroflexi bacterium]|nr:class I SAM-dependent methyltransferase [Chloroflexota bacterium]